LRKREWRSGARLLRVEHPRARRGWDGRFGRSNDVNHGVRTYIDFEDFPSRGARMPWLVCSICAGGGPGAFCPGICAVAIVEAASRRTTTGIGTDEPKLGWNIRSIRSMVNSRLSVRQHLTARFAIAIDPKPMSGHTAI
jgi:hypothetical protein